VIASNVVVSKTVARKMVRGIFVPRCRIEKERLRSGDVVTFLFAFDTLGNRGPRGRRQLLRYGVDWAELMIPRVGPILDAGTEVVQDKGQTFGAVLLVRNSGGTR
jgi:hypothetical protein